MVPGEMEGAHLPYGARGLRFVLCLINSSLVLGGAALAALGAEIDRFIAWRSLGNGNPPPPLWWLGVTPIVVGTTGVVCAATGRRKLVLVWVVCTSFMGAGSYTLLSLSGCLESQKYGVAVQIFGRCVDVEGHCECTRGDGGYNVLMFSTCADIEHLTIFYLSVIAVLIYTLGIGTTGTILGCVATMCVQHCLPKDHNNYGLTTQIPQTPVHATVHKSSSASNCSSCESISPSPLTEVSTAERAFTS